IKIEEKMKRINDVDITLLRPTMIYGSLKDKNMSRLIRVVDKFPIFPVFGRGKNLMQPVTAQDLGKAYYDVILNREITKNNNYNLSGKEEVEYKNIIKTISSILGKNIKLVHIPI